MNCRSCGTSITSTFLDLGFSPLANDYIDGSQLKQREIYLPLRLMFCEQCMLVQTEDYTTSEDIFRSDYAYFSSTSKTWLSHSKSYYDKIRQTGLVNEDDLVIEIGSNDGYLLQYFAADGVKCLGVEPTESTAKAAMQKGINVLIEFFGFTIASRIVKEYGKAKLIISNNVYAHVPDLTDFTRGMVKLLDRDGVITIEIPHLYHLIKDNLFDTVYHEHFSYYSLHALIEVAEQNQLEIFNVEELPTHGGSLRVYLSHKKAKEKNNQALETILSKEADLQINSIVGFQNCQQRALSKKLEVLEFIVREKNKGKHIAAYGAAAKGNTLLNYCGIDKDLIDFVCDKAEAKQNKLLPGSHIPIYHPEHIYKEKPDIIIVLPWNISNEVTEELKHVVSEWGGTLVRLMPKVEYL